jgi:hypothetical protein
LVNRLGSIRLGHDGDSGRRFDSLQDYQLQKTTTEVLLVKAFFIGVFVVLVLSTSIATAEWKILVDTQTDTIGNLEIDRPDLRCYIKL